MKRPYEYVPLYAIAILISEYEKLVKAGFYNLQPELDKMQTELNKRFEYKDLEDKQITIDEYIRSRKHEQEK